MTSKFFRKILLSLVTVGCSYIFTFAQEQITKIRPSIARIAKEMARYNQIDDQEIGESGFESEQWDRFDKLCKIATNAELRLLTDYPNAVVRCYAFHAMALRNDTAIFSILVSHLKDTEQAKTLSYDLGGSDKVADYFVNVVTPEYIDLRAYKLNEDQKAKLDSILLFDRAIRLGSKHNMLRQLKPNKRYYERVKEIAESENNGDGLIALSRYENPMDTTFISNYLAKSKDLYYGLYAVREFPDPVFYSKLIQIFEHEWSQKAYDYPLWRILYQALAKYPRSETLSLFERTIQSKDNFRYQTLGVYLTIAINKYPNPIFEDLKTKIKLDAYHLDEVQQEMNVEK